MHGIQYSLPNGSTDSLGFSWTNVVPLCRSRRQSPHLSDDDRVNRVSLFVEDSGPGIPPVDRPRLVRQVRSAH